MLYSKTSFMDVLSLSIFRKTVKNPDGSTTTLVRVMRTQAEVRILHFIRLQSVKTENGGLKLRNVSFAVRKGKEMKRI